MKTTRALLCLLLALVLTVPVTGLSAAASEEVTAETETISQPAGEAAPASESVLTTETETGSEPETDVPAEAASELTAEIENTAQTLGATPTAGTWDTCDVLVEGKLCYDYAYQVLEKLNDLRTANGLNELVMDTAMLEHAMLRAAETALYWEHTSPDGSTHNYGCDILYYHENIAHVYTTPSAAFNGWYNSSGHRENMLNSTLKTVGIGVFYIDGNYYWVQDFSRNRSSEAYESDYTDHWTTYTIPVADWLMDDYATVKLSDSSLSLGQTASFSVRYTLYPAFDLPASGLTYNSSDETVCTVSGDGTVTAVGGGTATITAWYPGYEDGAWTFTVTATVTPHDCNYEATATTAPGCETAGVVTYTCAICRKSYTEDIPPMGHEMSEEGVITKEPSCAIFGKRTYSCMRCDYTESELIAPTGHIYDSGKIMLMPSADADGSILYTCTVCNKPKTEALPFLLGDVNVDKAVTPADLVSLMKLTAGADGVFNRSAADVNADGSVGLTDVIRLTRHLADNSIELG